MRFAETYAVSDRAYDGRGPYEWGPCEADGVRGDGVQSREFRIVA